MIKKMLCLLATVALVLALGAGLGRWREQDVSLASEAVPAIAPGGVGK